MNTNLVLQYEFQKLAGQTPNDSRVVPTIQQRYLRLKLALEELGELAHAYGMESSFITLMYDNESKICEKSSTGNVMDTYIYNELEVLDATIDIEVINNGTIITNGHHYIYDHNYTLVDTNNKTKFHKSYDAAEKTKDFYLATGFDVEIYKIDMDGINYFVVKNIDGKVLKPFDYKKVELSL